MRSYNVESIEALIERITVFISSLEAVANRISSELESNGRSLTDIRKTAVEDIVTTLGLLKLQYIYVAECLLHYEWWDKHGFTNLTPKQKMQNASIYGDHIAFSTFHQAYSIYEGCLRQIHHSLDPVSLNESTDNIYKVFTALITDFGLSNFDVSEFKELHIFAGLIRNTIHNSGFYRSIKYPIQEVMYRGTSYRFEHLKPVLFLHPEELYVIIGDMGIMLAKLVSDPIVMALTDVRNPYRDNLPPNYLEMLEAINLQRTIAEAGGE
jgi:hypothetical protein